MSKPSFVVDTHNRYGEKLKIRYESKKGLNLDLCMELAEIARKHKQSLFKSDEKIDMDLIEAAPELLQAAEDLIEILDIENKIEWENIEAYKKLIEVVKKAKGGD